VITSRMSASSMVFNVVTAQFCGLSTIRVTTVLDNNSQKKELVNKDVFSDMNGD